MISGAKSQGGRLVGERICPEGFVGKGLFSTDNCYFVPPAANNSVVAYALRSYLDEFVLCSLIVFGRGRRTILACDFVRVPNPRRIKFCPCSYNTRQFSP